MEKHSVRYYVYIAVCWLYITAGVLSLITANWNPIMDNNLALIFFMALFGFGIYLYSGTGDESLVLITDTIGYAAMLAYGPAFASVIVIVPLAVHIYRERKETLVRSALVAIRVVELFVGAFIYFKLLGGSNGLVISPLELVYALGAGIAIAIIDRFALLILILLSDRRRLKEYIKSLASFGMAFLPLMVWGIIFAHLSAKGEYAFAIAMLVPVGMIYLYFRKESQLQIALQTVLVSLTKMVDMRDSYTYEHSQSVAWCAKQIAYQLKLSDAEADSIYQAGLLHDIGKVGVRDNVLLKKGPLSDQEWILMRRHPILGANLIRLLSFMNVDTEAIRHHHERWDGKGYPDHLAGERIPLAARIIAVCDAWNAMRTDRPYRKALSVEKALTEIERGKGTQFDPDIVDAAIAVFRKENQRKE